MSVPGGRWLGPEQARSPPQGGQLARKWSRCQDPVGSRDPGRQDGGGGRVCSRVHVRAGLAGASCGPDQVGGWARMRVCEHAQV